MGPEPDGHKANTLRCTVLIGRLTNHLLALHSLFVVPTRRDGQGLPVQSVEVAYEANLVNQVWELVLQQPAGG